MLGRPFIVEHKDGLWRLERQWTDPLFGSVSQPDMHESWPTMAAAVEWARVHQPTARFMAADGKSITLRRAEIILGLDEPERTENEHVG